MRITVRTMRSHGSNDDSYFKTWADAIAYMKRERKRRGEEQAVDFTVSFGDL